MLQPDVHDDFIWVVQTDTGEDIPPSGVIELPNMVMTTSAVMSITIAATTKARVVSITIPQPGPEAGAAAPPQFATHPVPFGSHLQSPPLFVSTALQEVFWPATFTLGMSQVAGTWPNPRQLDLKITSQLALASVIVEKFCTEPEKMVMTTSAVIRITIAATTTAKVSFMLDYCPEPLI
jgi:hypothetical protein